jgi:hypothetical protein
MTSARVFGTLALLLTISFAQFSLAQDAERSSKLCSTKNPKICAQVDFTTAINTTDEGKFDVVIQTPAGQSVSQFKADLWMEMGGGHHHGSAPLQITQSSAQKFHVEKAWFVMTGPWVIRLNFQVATENYEIKFPLTVKQ